MLELIAAAVTVGQYISVWKCIPVLIVLLLWGRLVTWIDKDAQAVMLPRVPINLANLMGGIAGLVLFFALPGFVIALAALCAFVAAETGVYLTLRSQKVGLNDISDQFSGWLKSFSSGEKEVKIIQGEVQLIGRDGNLMAAPDAESPLWPAYEAVQTLLAEPLRRNAEQIDLIPADGTATVRYIVDGVAYPGTSLDMARAASAVRFLKEFTGLDLNEKRKPQLSSVKVSVDGKRRDLQIQTAGSTAGEQLRASVDVKNRHTLKLEELGVTQDQFDVISEIIADPSGIVIVSAPKGHGMTTLQYAILRKHDAFLKLIHTIEPSLEAELEGITQNKVPAGAPGEPLRTVQWVIDQEPDVILMSRVEDAKVALALARYAATGKRVYVGLRATSAFDAMAAWRQLIGDDSAAVKDLRMIINSRVMRKLCSACKAGYAPDPATLRKLNIDPDKVGKLYQARTQPMHDAKGNVVLCEFCKELHFRGRTGVYEILLVDDDARAVIEAGGSENQLKAVFRKQRGRYLQEMAIAQVAAGETSIQEVLRVLKPEQKPPGTGPAPARPAPRPAA
jgi:general secretion pathway protein E